VALDRRTRAVRRVVGLGDALGDPISDFEFTEGGFPLWYRLWAVCGDGQIRVHDRLGNQVRRFASDGTELEPTALPPVNLDRVTPRQFGRAVFGYRVAEVLGEVGGEVTAADTTRVLNEIAQGVQGNGRELAAYLPRYVDFRCAADGTVWIQPFDVDRGGLEGGVAWLRITSDDVTGEIHFPERFDPYRFTTDRVWGVQRDEFDVASIAWIELPEDE